MSPSQPLLRSQIASSLVRLPQELLFFVTDFLSQVDLACLALCCRELSLRLPQAIAPFGALSEAVMLHRLSDIDGYYIVSLHRRFLRRIAPDFPAYYYCHDCGRLHSVEKILQARTDQLATGRHVVGPYNHSVPTDDLTAPFSPHIFNGINSFSSFSTMLLQLAMWRQCRGAPYGVSLDQLSSIEIHLSNHSTDGKDIPSVALTMLTIEPLIIANSMLLRVQQWIVSKRETPICSLTELRGKAMQLGGVCAHYYYQRPKHVVATLQALTDCKLHDNEEHTLHCTTCSRHLECTSCHTPIQLLHMRLDAGRTAWVITKWLNVGDSTYRGDERWTKYLRRYRRHPSVMTEARHAKELRDAYEASTSLSVHDLTLNNTSLLLADSYKKKLEHRSQHPFGGQHWFAANKQAMPWS